jgi:hypothetical protein
VPPFDLTDSHSGPVHFRHVRWKHVLLIGLLLFSAGCENPFSTRDAEPPSVRRGTWEEPIFYDAVLRNLTNAYNEQIIDNYTDSISEDFRFVPDPEDDARYPGVFDDWGFEQERDVTGLIFSSGTGAFIDLALADTTMEVTFYPSGDTVRAEVIYSLGVEQVLVTAPQEMAGRAVFYVSETTGNIWKVYRWEDSKADYPDSSSWGELKAAFTGG